MIIFLLHILRKCLNKEYVFVQFPGKLLSSKLLNFISIFFLRDGIYFDALCYRVLYKPPLHKFTFHWSWKNNFAYYLINMQMSGLFILHQKYKIIYLANFYIIHTFKHYDSGITIYDMNRFSYICKINRALYSKLYTEFLCE